jgi:hypothetical protein
MLFTPVTEEAADAQGNDLWPNGSYDYEIRQATETTSKAGNAMFSLEVWIYKPDGDRKLVFDYLVASDKAAWKIRSFAASCGLVQQYETGCLMEAEIVGRTGRCTVGTQAASNGYAAKNHITGYLRAEGAAMTPPDRAPARKPVPAGAGSDLDDIIPF